MQHHPIHHITAIASDPKQCIAFYRDILGLRLVKKTVNQDQTEAYHLFFGDKTGEPGMDLTFFTFPGVGQGENGVGAVTTIGLSVPTASLEYWVKRFDEHSVTHQGITEYYDTSRIVFFDGDNQKLALIGRPDQEITTMSGEYWSDSPVPQEHSIRCFDTAELSVSATQSTELIITHLLGFQPTDETENRSLYRVADHDRAARIEITEDPDAQPVYNAAGTVHHIAFEVSDEDELRSLRDAARDMGLHTTPVIDRFYFKSVYFRVPSGILFELATSGPGFTADEDEETLGENLSLPPFLESKRDHIEANLPPIK